MRKKDIVLPVFLTLCIFLSSCATIINGSKQTIGISSSPSEASVTINGEDFGKTPVNAELARKENQIIKIELEGYLPYETTLTRKVDAWIAGNILFGGLIGLGIDAISGGMYKLTPQQVQAELLTQTANTSAKDGIYLFVTLNPNPDWELVGMLEKK